MQRTKYRTGFERPSTLGRTAAALTLHCMQCKAPPAPLQLQPEEGHCRRDVDALHGVRIFQAGEAPVAGGLGLVSQGGAEKRRARPSTLAGGISLIDNSTFATLHRTRRLIVCPECICICRTCSTIVSRPGPCHPCSSSHPPYSLTFQPAWLPCTHPFSHSQCPPAGHNQVQSQGRRGQHAIHITHDQAGLHPGLPKLHLQGSHVGAASGGRGCAAVVSSGCGAGSGGLRLLRQQGRGRMQRRAQRGTTSSNRGSGRRC